MERAEIYIHTLNAKNLLRLVMTHIDFTTDEPLDAEDIRFAVECAFKEVETAAQGLATFQS